MLLSVYRYYPSQEFVQRFHRWRLPAAIHCARWPSTDIVYRHGWRNQFIDSHGPQQEIAQAIHRQTLLARIDFASYPSMTFTVHNILLEVTFDRHNRPVHCTIFHCLATAIVYCPWCGVPWCAKDDYSSSTVVVNHHVLLSSSSRKRFYPQLPSVQGHGHRCLPFPPPGTCLCCYHE